VSSNRNGTELRVSSSVLHDVTIQKTTVLFRGLFGSKEVKAVYKVRLNMLRIALLLSMTEYTKLTKSRTAYSVRRVLVNAPGCMQ
jgi:hypothetical protein